MSRAVPTLAGALAQGPHLRKTQGPAGGPRGHVPPGLQWPPSQRPRAHSWGVAEQELDKLPACDRGPPSVTSCPLPIRLSRAGTPELCHSTFCTRQASLLHWAHQADLAATGPEEAQGLCDRQGSPGTRTGGPVAAVWKHVLPQVPTGQAEGLWAPHPHRTRWAHGTSAPTGTRPGRPGRANLVSIVGRPPCTPATFFFNYNKRE